MKQHSWFHNTKRAYWSWLFAALAICTIPIVSATSILYLVCSYRTSEAVGQDHAILVLGGNWMRIAAIKPILKKLPNIPVVMSFTEVEAQYGAKILQRYGVSKSQIFHDCRAVDTVSNFTTTIDFFREREINNVFVVTDSEHMKRAMLIAHYVLGFYGIKATPHIAGVHHPRVADYWGGESSLRQARDAIRSALWILSGVDLSSITLLLPDWYRKQGSNCAANDALAERAKGLAAHLRQKSILSDKKNAGSLK